MDLNPLFVTIENKIKAIERDYPKFIEKNLREGHTPVKTLYKSEVNSVKSFEVTDCDGRKSALREISVVLTGPERAIDIFGQLGFLLASCSPQIMKIEKLEFKLEQKASYVDLKVLALTETYEKDVDSLIKEDFFKEEENLYHLIRQLLEAGDHMERFYLCHGAINPSNIFFCPGNKYKLGFSDITSNISAPSVFLAPENRSSVNPNKKIEGDIFSMGMVLLYAKNSNLSKFMKSEEIKSYLGIYDMRERDKVFSHLLSEMLDFDPKKRKQFRELSNDQMVSKKINSLRKDDYIMSKREPFQRAGSKAEMIDSNNHSKPSPDNTEVTDKYGKSGFATEEDPNKVRDKDTSSKTTAVGDRLNSINSFESQRTRSRQHVNALSIDTGAPDINDTSPYKTESSKQYSMDKDMNRDYISNEKQLKDKVEYYETSLINLMKESIGDYSLITNDLIGTFQKFIQNLIKPRSLDNLEKNRTKVNRIADQTSTNTNILIETEERLQKVEAEITKRIDELQKLDFILNHKKMLFVNKTSEENFQNEIREDDVRLETKPPFITQNAQNLLNIDKQSNTDNRRIQDNSTLKHDRNSTKNIIERSALSPALPENDFSLRKTHSQNDSALIGSLQQNEKILTAEITKLKCSLAEEQDRSQKCFADLENERKSRSETTAEINKLVKELTSNKEILTKTINDKANLTNTLNKSDVKLKANKLEIEKMKAESEKLEAELEKLKAELEKLKDDHSMQKDALQKKIRDLVNDVNDGNDKIKEEGKKHELEKDHLNNQFQQKIGDMQAALDRKHEQATKLQNQLDEKTKQLTDSEKRHNEWEQNLQKKFTDKTNEAYNLKNQVTSLTDAATGMSSKIKELSKSEQKLLQDVKDLQSENKALQKDLETEKINARETIDREKHENMLLKEKIASLEFDVEQKRSNIKTLESKNEELNTNVLLLTEQIALSKTKRQRMESKVLDIFKNRDAILDQAKLTFNSEITKTFERNQLFPNYENEKILTNPAKAHIAYRYNIYITSAEIDILQKKQWLNDIVINFFCHYLNEKIKLNCQMESHVKLNHIFSSIFFSNLCPKGPQGQSTGQYDNVRNFTKEYSDKNFVMNKFNKMGYIINLNNNHWIWAVIDTQNKKVTVYDSLNGSHTEVQQILLEYVKSEIDDKFKVGAMKTNMKAGWVTQKGECPQQPNLSDCGVFVCMNMYLLYKNEELNVNSYNHNDIVEFREKLALLFSQIGENNEGFLKFDQLAI